MKLYETTVIFDPGLEEARVNEEVERVTQPIAQAGGEVIEVQRWGKRKLAYMIRKRRDGSAPSSPTTSICGAMVRSRCSVSPSRSTGAATTRCQGVRHDLGPFEPPRSPLAQSGRRRGAD